MNVSWFEKAYVSGLLLIFGLIVLHAPLSVWLGTFFPDYELLIKSWKELLMALLIPVTLIVVTKRHLWHRLVKDPIFYIISGYAALHIALVALFYKGMAPTLAGMAIDLRYVLFFALIYGLLRAVPAYRRLFLTTGVIGAFIIVGFGALQLFLPVDILANIGYSKDTIEPYLTVDKNDAYIRVNSTLRGPNPLGAYSAMLLTLIAATWTKGRLAGTWYKVGAGVMAVCALVSLWISYSRSALVAAFIGLAIVFALSYGRRLSRNVWIGTTVVVFGLLGAIIAARDTAFVSNVILHDDPTTGGEVTSDQQHAESLVDGLSRMMSQPFGAGIGSTGSASLYGDQPVIIENQYLFVAHEAGWLGLLLFATLFVMILIRAWQHRQDWLALGVFASGVELGLIGLLQPVWVDDAVSIIWWGLAAVAIVGGKNDRTATK